MSETRRLAHRTCIFSYLPFGINRRSSTMPCDRDHHVGPRCLSLWTRCLDAVQRAWPRLLVSAPCPPPTVANSSSQYPPVCQTSSARRPYCRAPRPIPSPTAPASPSPPDHRARFPSSGGVSCTSRPLHSSRCLSTRLTHPRKSGLRLLRSSACKSQRSPTAPRTER